MCKCVVTLSVYPTPGKLKNQPDHGGNRTCDLWFASPMLYQLSYEVKSVRVSSRFECSNTLLQTDLYIKHSCISNTRTDLTS